MTDRKYENHIWFDNHIPIGIDEVGRGAVAGPVCVGAIMFPLLIEGKFSYDMLPQFRDSKKLSQSRRKYLYEYFQRFIWSVSFVSNKDIDAVGINAAISRATEMAISKVIGECLEEYSFGDNQFYILADNGLHPFAHPRICGWEEIVKGDDKSITIAAASIIAKHVRDSHMMELHEEYNNWKFGKNKGYYTIEHREAVKRYGYSDLPRTRPKPLDLSMGM